MRRLAPLAAVAGMAALAGPAMADVRFDSRRRFRDVGSYRLQNHPNQRVTVWMSGRKVGPRRWAGRFRARLVVRRNGRVVNRCSVGGVRWRAVRVRR